MSRPGLLLRVFFLCFLTLALGSYACAYYGTTHAERENNLYRVPYDAWRYASRMPQQISPPGEKVIIVNPRVHAWAAYGPDGRMVRGGLASAGSSWCADLGRRCHTKSGSFRVMSLGSAGCISHTFPLGRGGAPMPYCMYFNRGQALHGAPEGEVVDGNVSHGCVRLHVSDAEWLRFNFVNVGTRVVILPY